MYSRDQVHAKIANIIEELFEIPADEVKLESRLYEDLDLDSIDAVDLIVKLQEFVNQRVEPSQFKGVRTVADVVSAAEEILKENTAVANEN